MRATSHRRHTSVMPLLLVAALSLLCLCAPSLPSTHAAAPLRLNNAFSSNMVLQRAPQQAAMWGYGVAYSSLKVAIDGDSAATGVVSSDGRWSVKLPATDASLNRTVTVSDGNTTVTLSNVAFGDVYLCSGQSNMQVTFNYSFGGPEALAAASKYPNLRLFNIPPQYSNTTVEEARISYPSGWVLPSRSTLQNPNAWTDWWSYFSATCYWTGTRLYDSLNGSVAIGLLQNSYGGTCAAAWTSPDTNTKCGPIVTPVGTDNTAYNQPSVLFNALVFPLLPMRFRAVLWYQGETDWWDAERYACSFPNMIQDWRIKFQQPDLPFYFVLLAPYNGASYQVRQSQQQALLLPNTGVANAIDLGDHNAPAGDVHPRNKSYVGERLSLLARRHLYGQQVEADAPLLVSVKAVRTANSTFHLTLQYSDNARSSGMFALPTPGCYNQTYTARDCCVQTATNQYTGLIYYSYRFNGRTYTVTSAVSIDPALRTISTTQQPTVLPVAGQPMTVSYAFADWPGCALYNAARLPALPFQMNTTVVTGPSPSPAASALAELRLNNAFSSNMVLQRAPQQAVMWGYGVADSTVTVRLDGVNVATGVVSSDGRWSVKLPATDASFNRAITASDGTTTITLTNVAFGDVYLCSGQSNMQITVNYSFGGADAIAAAASYSDIRLFSMYSAYSDTPLDESMTLAYAPNSWVLPSAATLQLASQPTNPWSYFSATCYWTGVYISNSLNHSIPIGLVQASYGGTMIEAWTSPDTNTKCGPLAYPRNPAPPDQGSVIYNAMIYPLLPMRFTAVLWYQGESDAYAIDRYACSFPNMIDDWRTKFGYGALLPFYFVLLSPYTGCDPRLRQAQLAAFPSQSVGVASAIDLGDKGGVWGEIHPRNKSFVGERLARWVRRDIYHQTQQVWAQGPERIRDTNAINVTVSSADNATTVTVVVTYYVNDASSGLYTLPSPGCTTCCAGGAGLLQVTINDTASGASNATFTYRPAVTIDPIAVTLTASFIAPSPLSDTATATIGLEAEDWPQCILYNKYQLPALPFILTVPVNGGSGGGVVSISSSSSGGGGGGTDSSSSSSGGGGGSDDSSSSHLGLYIGLIAAALVAVVVVTLLVLRYRKQRAGSGAESAGYRDIDERRSGLLNDSRDTASY